MSTNQQLVKTTFKPISKCVSTLFLFSTYRFEDVIDNICGHTLGTKMTDDLVLSLEKMDLTRKDIINQSVFRDGSSVTKTLH